MQLDLYSEALHQYINPSFLKITCFSNWTYLKMGLCVLVCVENILKMTLFENDDTCIYECDFPVQVFCKHKS